MRTTDARGFTLIELLIVVVVISVLAAIAMPRLDATRRKAFRATMMSDLRAMADAQEIYHNSHYTYASTAEDAEARASDGVTITVNEASSSGWSATAVHLHIDAGQCGVYHGSAAPTGGAPATSAGVVTCDF